MKSLIGLRGKRCLQASRGVLQTTTDDDNRRRWQTPTPITSLAPYTMCRRASNKQAPTVISKAAAVPIRHPLQLQRHSSELDPHLIDGSSDPQESAPQPASRSVQPFLHSTPMWPKHRHTDHITCDICSKRPHLMHFMQVTWPKKH